MKTSTQVKYELFIKLLDDMDDALAQNPQGDVKSVVGGVLDKVNLSVID